MSKTGQLFSISQLVKHDPAFTSGSIRWTVHLYRDELIGDGVIFYSGKKLIIDREKYIEFLKNIDREEYTERGRQAKTVGA